jgi:phosphatidylserine/phosphatidylglycerophosphate/cardiolipin synthase-like enzyme
MNETAPWLILGSLLLGTNDPMRTSPLLQAYLLSGGGDVRESLEQAGVPCRIVDDFRSILPTGTEMLSRACELGAAWVAGRRSVPAPGSWQPVVTGPDMDPRTFERLTAETLIGLVVGADQWIRLFTPFLDARGIEPLAFALAAATKRGVEVCIGYRLEADRTHAIARLLETMRIEGDPDRCEIVSFSGDQFPHLKLLIVDGVRAYIGSANITYAGLTKNYEVGALVDGTAVEVYELLLDEVLGQRGRGGRDSAHADR